MNAQLIFDRSLLARRRARAQETFAAHDFLFRLMAESLEERLLDTTRRFARAALLGERSGMLRESAVLKQRAEEVESLPLPADERLACPEGRYDLILSLGEFHWVNDLPGLLLQIRRALKEDGLLLSIFPGGRTLHELRDAFAHASIAEEGGVSPRLSPMVDVRDAGALLQRAGFALPVADSELIRTSYADPLALMRELRGMGEANALIERPRKPLRRATLAAMMEEYAARHPAPDGRIAATFELVAMSGWKPHESQPVAARRGSGKVSLKNILGG